MPRQLPPSGAGIEFSRRTFLKGSAAAGVALAGGALWTTAIHPRRVHAVETPIRHVILACQENRSFDHYLGYAPRVQAAGFGPPPGYGQPNGPRGLVAPFRLTAVFKNRSRYTAGRVSSEGPVSNAKPSRRSDRTLPPCVPDCSTTVTEWPCAVSRAAAAIPPMPAPTTTMADTVSQRRRSTLWIDGCRPGGLFSWLG